MTLNKKSQVETSFNWLFMLIAGAVILLFFITVIYNMQESSTKGTQVTIVNRMNSILSGTELGQKTSSLIESFPDINMEFQCEGYSIEDFTGSYESRITFAPSVLPIRPLVVWTQDWNMPYFISNFLLVTSPQIRYVFVYNDALDSRNFKEQIEDLLPSHVNKDFVLSSQIVTNTKTAYTRFIFLETNPDTYVLDSSFKNSQVSALRIQKNNVLNFYEKLDDDTSFVSKGSNVYYDESTMIAAIVTDTEEYYACMLGKAFDRYNQVSYIISERTKLLKQYRTDCTNFYKMPAETLAEQIAIFAERSKTNPLSDSELQDFIAIVPALISQLKEINEEILPRKSCPLIY